MRATSPRPRSRPNASVLTRPSRSRSNSCASSRPRPRGLPESAAEEIGYLLDAHLAMLSNSRLVRGAGERIGRAADQCRARCRARNRRNRPELRGDARSLSGGAGRGYPRRRHAADPQPDQETLRRLFGRARGRGYPCRRTDPGRHRADGPAADRRLCRPVRRRRKPHRDRRSRARPAGGARRARLDRARARRSDRGRRRRRGDGHHRPDARDDRPIRGPARRADARTAPSEPPAPAAGGDPRRRRNYSRSQSRAADRARAGDRQRRDGSRPGSVRISLHEPRRSAGRGRAIRCLFGPGARHGRQAGNRAHLRSRRRQAG